MSEQTALARPNAPAPPALVTGGEVAAIIPRTVDEMFRLATAIHQSGLAPKTMNDQPKILVAIMAGAELGMPPHQAVQSYYVVNGRPTLWGDALPALLWSNGFKLKEWYEGEGEKFTARCEVTRPGGDVIPGEFSMEDAKRAGLLGKDGPWKTATKRMLKMRARAFAARDGAADVLRGMQIREEVDDYQPLREAAPKTDLRSRLGGGSGGEGFSAGHVARETGGGIAEADFDPVTGEVAESTVSQDLDGDNIDHIVGADAQAAGQDDSFPGDQQRGGGDQQQETEESADRPFDPLSWAADLTSDLDSMSLEEIDAFIVNPTEVARFEALKAAHAKGAENLDKAIVARRRALGWKPEQ